MTGLDVRREGRVLVLTMNDPPTRNAIGPEMMGAASAALDTAAADPEVGALVLTGVALVWRLRGQVACPVPPAAGA